MHNFSSRYARLTGAAVLTVALAACGGGKSDDDKNDNADNGGGGNTPEQPVEPGTLGQLQAATLLGTVPLAAINEALADKESRLENLQPRYGVTSYRIEYLTSDAKGKTVQASGLVSVPDKPAGAKSPVLSYQHGTIFRDAEAPSNNAVASEISVVMASLGYIVLAPDYVG